MGEHALYGRERIKIGTCENMYYLRFDQRHLVSLDPEGCSLDVHDPATLREIRFRFPFPDEDHLPPGAFRDHCRGVRLPGVLPPDDVSHYEDHAPAAVEVVQQKYRDGALMLVGRCSQCKSLWRYPELADVESLARDVYTIGAAESDPERKQFWLELGLRILRGYTEPPDA